MLLLAFFGCASQPEPPATAPGAPDTSAPDASAPALVVTTGEGTGTCEAPIIALTLSNEGNADLVVSGFDLTHAATTAETPFTIAAAEAVDLTFTADGPGTATIGIVSNDPEGTGYLLVSLSDCSALPVADADASLGEVITWDGSGSYSPTGYEPLAYDWALVSRPDGSGATMDGTGAHPTTTPDLPGVYVAELTVSDAEGLVSDPARVSVTVD